jgi:hypothetical protein
MTLVLTTLLAEEPTMTGPDFGKASPVGLLVVRLGAVYTITVLLLVLLFVLLWRRQSGHPGRIDEPPLVAAQPV